jgi:Protein of unknown function (DUF2834).
VKGWRLTLLACVTVSFACGGPLFLYLRERRLNELAADVSAASPEKIFYLIGQNSVFKNPHPQR